MDDETQFQSIANAVIKNIPVNKLKFDVENIRLAHLQFNEVQIEAKLNEIGSIDELVDQIIAAGTILEPLVVREQDNVVIEGNRRLAACKKILERINNDELRELSKSNFNSVKCKIIPKSIDSVYLALYLVSIHVKTKKPWQLFNRAHHIHDLYKIHGLTYDVIAEYGFMSKTTIERTIRCYKLTKKYGKKFPKDDEWFKKYSYFWQLNTSKELYEFRQNSSNIEKYMNWINDNKFKMYQEVRDLPKILSNKEAYYTFVNCVEPEGGRGNSFHDAIRIVEKTDPGLTNRNFKIIRQTINIVKQFTRQDIRSIKNDTGKLDYIKELSNEINIFVKELNIHNLSQKSKD